LFRLLPISLAGWLNQRQQDVIDYLQKENHVLRDHSEASGCASTKRSAATPGRAGQEVGLTHELTTMVTPGTLSAWQRRPIIEK
jgi:hypothetical protein